MNLEAPLPPVTPGEILRNEFLEPVGITPYRLAQDIHVQQTRIGAWRRAGFQGKRLTLERPSRPAADGWLATRWDSQVLRLPCPELQGARRDLLGVGQRQHLLPHVRA